MQFLIFALVMAAFFVLVIRPQQKRLRAQQAVVASLAVGDDVISSAGIYGRIIELDDEVAVLQVGDDVQLRFARQAIARKVDHPAFANDEPELDLDELDDDPDADLEPDAPTGVAVDPDGQRRDGS